MSRRPWRLAHLGHDHAERPTADHYARALEAACALMGERDRLTHMAMDPQGAAELRHKPLKGRPIAFAAMRVRFPNVAPLILARTLGLATASPKAAKRYSQLATVIAARI